MDVGDAMCRTIMSAGARRGAMMGTMRCDYPDIQAFNDAEHDPETGVNLAISATFSVELEPAFIVPPALQTAHEH